MTDEPKRVNFSDEIIAAQKVHPVALLLSSFIANAMRLIIVAKHQGNNLATVGLQLAIAETLGGFAQELSEDAKKLPGFEEYLKLLNRSNPENPGVN